MLNFQTNIFKHLFLNSLNEEWPKYSYHDDFETKTAPIIEYINGSWDKEEALKAYEVLNPQEKQKLNNRYKEIAKAKRKLYILQNEIAWNEEVKIEAQKIPEELDKTLESTKTMLSKWKIDFWDILELLEKKSYLLAVLNWAIKWSFFKDAEFIKKVEEFKAELSKLSSYYYEYVKNNSERENSEFEELLKEISINSAIDIIDWIEFLKKEVKNVTDVSRLSNDYKKYKNESWPRLIIANRLAELLIYDKKNRIGYFQTSWTSWNDIVIIDDKWKEVSMPADFPISKKDLRYLMIIKWYENLELKITEYWKEWVINKLLGKYKAEINDRVWSEYNYNDLFDKEKNKQIVEKIDNAIAYTKDKLKLKELTLLLEYVRNPEVDSTDAPLVWAHLGVYWYLRDENGSPIDYTKYKAVISKIAANPDKSLTWDIFSDIMWSNGWITWMAIVMLSVVWLFMPEFRKYVFWWWMSILALTAWEELLKKWWLWDMVKEHLPESGKNALEKVKNNINWPEYEVKSLPKKSNYNTLYMENKNAWEEKQSWVDKLDEETFAQIYGQLSSSKEFRKMKIKWKIDKLSTANLASELSSELPTEYKDWLLEVNWNKKLSWKKAISASQVETFIKILLTKQENTLWDETWADLFVEWGKFEKEVYVSWSNFESNNTAITEAFDNIPNEDKAKPKIESVLKQMTEWSLENWQIWLFETLSLSALEKKSKKLDELIKELKWIWWITAWSNTEKYLKDIIAEFGKIKTKLENAKNLEEKMKGARDAWKLYYGQTALAVWLNWVSFAFNSLYSKVTWNPYETIMPEVDLPKMADIDKAIWELKWLLSWLDPDNKIKVDNMIYELYAKKVYVLNEQTKDKSLSPTDITRIKWEIVDLNSELLILKPDMYLEKINSSEEDLKSLKEKHTDFDWYTEKLIANWANLKLLHQIAEIDDAKIARFTDAKDVKKRAEELIKDYYDEFKTNFEKLIGDKKWEISTLSTAIATISTTDLVKFNWARAKYNGIRNEIYAESFIPWIKETNRIDYIIKYAKENFWDTSLSTLDTLKVDLDSIKYTLDARIQTQENALVISVTPVNYVTDITEVRRFITDVKKQEEIIKTITTASIKTTKENEKKAIVSRFIEQLINEVNLPTTDKWKLAELSVIYDIVNSDIWNGWNNDFNDALENKKKELRREEILKEHPSKLSPQFIETRDEFINDYKKYSRLNSNHLQKILHASTIDVLYIEINTLTTLGFRIWSDKWSWSTDVLDGTLRGKEVSSEVNEKAIKLKEFLDRELNEENWTISGLIYEWDSLVDSIRDHFKDK